MSELSAIFAMRRRMAEGLDPRDGPTTPGRVFAPKVNLEKGAVQASGWSAFRHQLRKPTAPSPFPMSRGDSQLPPSPSISLGQEQEAQFSWAKKTAPCQASGSTDVDMLQAVYTDAAREVQQELDAARQEIEELRASLAAQSACCKELEAEKGHLLSENDCLKKRLDEQQCATSTSTSSTEGVLRTVLAKPSATVTELKSAITGVDSLLNEARRMLEQTQTRERRAAHEELYAALEEASEERLESAIAEATRAEVHAEDVEKAELKLAELKQLTFEERRLKDLQKLKAETKPELFLLVKRGAALASAAAQLDAKLQELEEASVRWQDWRDHNGRTLLSYAEELGAESILKVLQSRLGMPLTEAASDSGATTKVSAVKRMRNLLEEFEEARKGDETPATTAEGSCSSASESPQDTPRLGGTFTPATPRNRVATSASEEDVDSSEWAAHKKDAFRAVTRDDVPACEAIIQVVPLDVWTTWRNKAGKDLLELAAERGSRNVQAILEKSQGNVIERKREFFEERETVWVLMKGEVQARQATVLEDTPEGSMQVLVEFWEGNGPPEIVDTCCVTKAYR